MTYRTFSILSIANAVAIGVIFLAWTWPAWQPAPTPAPKYFTVEPR